MKIILIILMTISILQSKILKTIKNEYKERIYIDTIEKCPSEKAKGIKSKSRTIYRPNTKTTIKNGIKTKKVYGLNKFREHVRTRYTMCINEKNTIIITNKEITTIEDFN